MKQLKLFSFLIACLNATMVICQDDFDFTQSEKLPASINSEAEEGLPIVVGNRLYFTRSLHPQNLGGTNAGQDIWVSEINNEQFGTATNPGKPLNNLLNNAVIGASNDGSTLFLLSTYEKKLQLQPGFSSADTAGSNWADPRALDVKGLAFKSDFYGGFVSHDGQVLIISMDSKKSLGQEDLYVSFREDDSWTKPLHLGEVINSTEFEISPFLTPDHKTLFFASAGHSGMGEADIFYAKRLDSSWTNWSTPTNLGEPINTPQFDAYPFLTAEGIYYSSNRSGALSDLYYSRNNLMFMPADSARITLESNGVPLERFSVELQDRSGKTIQSAHTESSVVTIADLLANREYQMKVKSEQGMEISAFTAFLLSKQGQKVSKLSRVDSNMFEFTALEAESVAALQPIAEEQPNGFRGVFEFNKLPVRNILMVLLDKSGNALQYARTNGLGQFAFQEMPEGIAASIEVVSDLSHLKENGQIYAIDESGEKLYKASGEGGKFKYQKLKPEELAQLKMLKELDGSKPELGAGVFKYQSLPRAGVTLQLLDENDNVIETVITDADGNFKFSKMDADKEFVIKIEDETLRDEATVQFVDNTGQELQVLKFTEAGGFEYKPLDPELRGGLARLEEEDASGFNFAQTNVFSIGMFKYQNLPKEGITLELLDENDNVIETVTTDANGQFMFSKLRDDSKYFVRVAQDNEALLEESSLFFVSNVGEVSQAKPAQAGEKFELGSLDSDFFYSISDVNEGATQLIVKESFKDVGGVFKYQNLPKSGVKLYLVDENDNIIDTVYTDESGRFKFKKLARELNYFIKLAEEDSGLMPNASFALENEDSEMVDVEMTESGTFNFSMLPKDVLAKLNKEGVSDTKLNFAGLIPEEEAAEDAVEPIDADKNDLKLSSIYFHFNSIRLSTRDRAHINKTVLPKIAGSSQPVLVIGFTCDLGEDSANRDIAEQRAQAVRKYLTNMGVEPHRLEVQAVGSDIAPDESASYEQRVESRRVDIFYLAP